MGAFVAEHGKLDMVVAGAAGNFVSPADKLSANGFETVVAIDLLGTFHIFRAAIDLVEAGREASFLRSRRRKPRCHFRFKRTSMRRKPGSNNWCARWRLNGARGGSG